MQELKIPPPEELWGNREQRILRVLFDALKLLQKETSLPDDEDSITPILYLKIRRVNHHLWKSGRGGLHNFPVWEAHNQPLSEEDLNKAYINKQPDIQWEISDQSEEDYEKATKFFTIECKRLGYPSSASWILNENYVKEGILRFLKKEFSYGKLTSFGIMVGYVQSMQLGDILNEVNGYLQSESITKIILSINGWKINGVSRLDQGLNRVEVLPGSFDLRHLWVDLRNSYYSRNN